MSGLLLLGAGFGLAVASSAIGEKIDRGDVMRRPRKPLVMNIASGAAGIAASIAMVGGFFLHGWIWLGVMLGAIIIASMLFLPLPRTPLTTTLSGVLGTALLMAGWTAS